MKLMVICLCALLTGVGRSIGQVKNDEEKTESKAIHYKHAVGCPKEGVSIWPFGDTLYPNSFMLIQGLGKDQNLVKGLGSEYRVYLSSTKGNVNLKVVDRHDSRSNVFQCLLKPETELQVGVRYKLVFEKTVSKNKSFKPILYDENTYCTQHPYHRASLSNNIRNWMVVENPNTSKSDSQQMTFWDDDPYEYYKLAGFEQGTMGMINFESNYISFKYPSGAKSEFIIRAKVLHKKSEKESTLYIIPNDNEILLGRPNMCYGNYEFLKDEIYRVRFQIIDIYGYENRSTRERSFVSPR